MVIGTRLYLELNSMPAAENPTVSSAPERMPEFILNDLGGVPRSISEWSGRPLLINFWATWCAPCRREIPLLQALHTEEATTGIQVVGIAIDRLPDVVTFVGEYGVSYPNLVGEEDAMAASDLFGLTGLGLPFSVLAAADGHILAVHIGEIDAAQLSEIAGISSAYDSGSISLEAARAGLAAL